MELIAYTIIAIAGYLLGSIPTGYWVGRAKGVDIRQAGSGNIGATNAFRVLGKPAGIFVLAMDALKGFAACQWAAPLVITLLDLPANPDFSIYYYGPVLAGLAAILGHLFPCWLRFQGGKGIATTGGVFGALAWQAVLLTVTIWLLVLALTRYVSLASIAAAITLPIMVWLTNGQTILVLLTVCISLLALYKHKSNMRRLLQGTEHRFGSSKPVAAHKSTP